MQADDSLCWKNLKSVWLWKAFKLFENLYGDRSYVLEKLNEVDGGRTGNELRNGARKNSRKEGKAARLSQNSRFLHWLSYLPNFFWTSAGGKGAHHHCPHGGDITASQYRPSAKLDLNETPVALFAIDKHPTIHRVDISNTIAPRIK